MPALLAILEQELGLLRIILYLNIICLHCNIMFLVFIFCTVLVIWELFSLSVNPAKIQSQEKGTTASCTQAGRMDDSSPIDRPEAGKQVEQLPSQLTA